MSQFFYFLTIEGNEPLLKYEVQSNYPDLKFSYSRPGFCTFKNTGDDLSLEEFSGRNFIFALSYGQNIGRITLGQVQEKVEDLYQKDIRSFKFHQLGHLGDEEDWIPNLLNPFFGKEQFPCFDFVRTHGNEVFVGKRLPDEWHSPFLRKATPEKEGVISRAYYKGADAFKILNIPKGLEVLELGCVPGGTTQFLLENDYKVIGVDPGEMDPKLLSHKNFRFHQKSAQDFKISKDNNISVLTSDINLNPKMVLGECQRLGTFLKSLKYVLVTCKINDPHRVGQIKHYKKALKEMGCRKIRCLQLPYHRKEFLIFGTF
jgi:23S rRNA (cytidine2498-2'-O)-methyltransferase